jgi:hypothetical protein
MQVNQYINCTTTLERSSMKLSLGTWGGIEIYVGVGNINQVK